MISLRLQIQEVVREISLRENVYPKWVHAGKMRRGEADEHLERMRAVLQTLERLEAQDT